MTTRGVHKSDVTMVTSRMLGAFRDNGETRREFLTMIGRTSSLSQAVEFVMAGEIVDSVEMLRRLVAFDTTSRNSNLALIEYVQGYLEGHGVGVEAGAERGRQEGQPVRHRRAQREGRRGAVAATPTSCRSTASPGTPIRGR